jgi:hypothetical protein
MADTGARRCQAITGDGDRCKRYDTSPNNLCLVHDPARRAEWVAARRRGQVKGLAASAAGRAERALLKPTTLEDPPPPLERTLEGVVRFLAWVAMQVAGGKMAPKQGSTTTYALTTLRAALVARDLEDQLKAARAQLAAVRASQKGAA